VNFPRAAANKIFINNQLATQSLLRDLRPFLVDIHGQGDQQTLLNPDTHLELLDAFAGDSGVAALRPEVAESYQRWRGLKRELAELKRDEAEKFQLVDILKFQIDELERAQLAIGEDSTLEEERRRLQNVEKLTLLCAQSYDLIYEDTDAALTRRAPGIEASRRIRWLRIELSRLSGRTGIGARCARGPCVLVARLFGKAGVFAGASGADRESTGGNIQPQAEVMAARLRVRSNTWHDRKIVCSRSSMPARPLEISRAKRPALPELHLTLAGMLDLEQTIFRSCQVFERTLNRGRHTSA